MIAIVEVDIVHVFAIMTVVCHVLNEVSSFFPSKDFYSSIIYQTIGISCPYLTPPEHGHITYSNGNKFGSRATYECIAGFVLEGSKYRHCQGDMWWGPSETVPYCAKEGNVLLEKLRDRT